MKHAGLIINILSTKKVDVDFDGYFDYYNFFCTIVPALIKAGETSESAEKICSEALNACKGEPRFIKNIK